MANQESIVKYLVDYFPELIESRDNVSDISCSNLCNSPPLSIYPLFQEGRSPLHYADALQGTTGGVNQLQQYLIDHGADITVVDAVQCVLSVFISYFPLFCLHICLFPLS